MKLTKEVPEVYENSSKAQTNNEMDRRNQK